MKALMRYLRSDEAVLIGAMLALTPQLWHTVTAFVKLDVGGSSNLWNYAFGIFFAFSTSFAIILFTVRGRRAIAYFFLAVEVFINLIHYSVLNMDLGPTLFATLFMCLIVPVTISTYSGEINVNEEEPASPPLPEPNKERPLPGARPNGAKGNSEEDDGFLKPKTKPFFE